MLLLTHKTFTHFLSHKNILLKFLVSLWFFFIWDVVLISELSRDFENISLNNMRDLVRCWFVNFTFYLWEFFRRRVTISQCICFPIIKFLDGMLIEVCEFLFKHLKGRQFQNMIITAYRSWYNRTYKDNLIIFGQLNFNLWWWLIGQPVETIWDFFQWDDTISQLQNLCLLFLN